MDTNMENDYRDKWCSFFSIAAGCNNSLEYSAKFADWALEELKKRDSKKFFDHPEKGYR